jgi:uncharacterized membrane protein
VNIFVEAMLSLEGVLSLILIFFCLLYVISPWFAHSHRARSVMLEASATSQEERRKVLLEEIEFEYHSGKITQESYERGQSEIESITKSEA